MFKREVIAAAILALSGVEAKRKNKWSVGFTTIEMQAMSEDKDERALEGYFAISQRYNMNDI